MNLNNLNLFVVALTFITVTGLSGCSKDPASDEHFASSQQRALEKAKDVENVLQQADEKKRQQLENQEN